MAIIAHSKQHKIKALMGVIKISVQQFSVFIYSKIRLNIRSHHMNLLCWNINMADQHIISHFCIIPIIGKRHNLSSPQKI